MKRLLIIVEGDSEKEFVNNVLRPYLNTHQIYSIDCFKIKHSKGGLSKYLHFKKDILNVLFEPELVITTLIDYYSLPKDFPKYQESRVILPLMEKLDFLEASIKEDIEKTRNGKFPYLLPYIQLHEFEALIFSSNRGITALFDSHEANLIEIDRLIAYYPNPEEINNNPLTAPSKRLIKNIKGYNKVVHGSLILEEIGIPVIAEKCQRFNLWLNQLIRVVKE